MHAMRTRRFVHSLVVIAALLFSQWVVAAHACAMAAPAAAQASAAAHDPCCPEPAVPNTCEQHCAYGNATLDQPKPVAMLDVTLGPSLAVPMAPAAPRLERIDRAPPVAPDPPPSIRFSVLRI